MEYDHQVMRFSIEDGKLKAEIDIADLVYLFHTEEENYNGDDETPYAVVKEGQEEKFAEHIVKYLMDDNEQEDAINWAIPIRRAFSDLLEGYDPEFLSYYEDGEVTPEQLARWKKENGL